MNSAPGGFSDQEHGNAFRVLDYGFGSGRIVGQLKKRNVEASGCDVFYQGGSLLVPPGSVDALAAALDRLMGDAALRVQFAARAVEAREGFSMERIAGMWEKLFAE